MGIVSSLTLRLAPALIGCWLASNAAAATLEGVTLPDTYTAEGKSLSLNGIGLRTLTFLHIHAYVAALYLPRQSHDAEQIMALTEPKVLILKFMRSGSKDRIEKQYRTGEQENCGDGSCDPSDRADFERLVAAAPAVEAGDTSTYIFTARGLRVLANNRLIGDFANRDLAHLILAGFIGKHPPSQELRRQLLGIRDE